MSWMSDIWDGVLEGAKVVGDGYANIEAAKAGNALSESVSSSPTKEIFDNLKGTTEYLSNDGFTNDLKTVRYLTYALGGIVGVWIIYSVAREFKR